MTGAPLREVRPATGQSVRGRVLLVDDNEANRAVAVGILAVLGCGADVAVDARGRPAAPPSSP
jgi:hypothetical protein